MAYLKAQREHKHVDFVEPLSSFLVSQCRAKYLKSGSQTLVNKRNLETHKSLLVTLN